MLERGGARRDWLSRLTVDVWHGGEELAVTGLAHFELRAGHNRLINAGGTWRAEGKAGRPPIPQVYVQRPAQRGGAHAGHQACGRSQVEAG